MLRRKALIGSVGACAAVAAVLAATASPAVRTAAADSAQSCSNPIQIGMLGPFTGPAASIGSDQLHWAQFFANNWNKTHKLQLTIVQGDTQLDPAKASVVAQSMASNSSIVGIIGPAGSQEVTATAPILKKAGLAFISGSATNVSLTDGKLRGLLLPRRPERRRAGPDRGELHDQEPRRQEGHDGHDRRRPGVVLDGPRRHRRQRAQEGRRDGRPRVDQPEDDRLLVARRQGRRLDEGRVPAVPALVAGPALRPAAEVAGQVCGRVRQRRHVRLEEVQRERELRLVLRSRRDDDRGQQGHRRRVQQGVPGRHEPVRRSQLRGRAALRDGRDGWRARTARSPAPSSARRSRR